MLQRAIGPQAARASLLFGMRFDAEAAVRYGLALEVADDPVAAARATRRRPGGRATRRGHRDQGLDAGDRQSRVSSTPISTGSPSTPNWDLKPPRSPHPSSPGDWLRPSESDPERAECGIGCYEGRVSKRSMK